MVYNEGDLFALEVKEKKNQTYGHRARTGRGSSKSRKGMNTPYDFMNKEEKNKLNGAVTMTNLFDTIISREEFDTMDEKQQKSMMTHWRDIYPNSKIMEEMGITGSGTFHAYINKLDIPRKKRLGGRPRKSSIKKEIEKVPTQVEQAPENTPIVNDFVQQPVKLITNGLHLEYNGLFSAEQINRILTKIQLIVDGEDNDFNIELRISETEKKGEKNED
jgi:hypothetical protein